MRVTSREGITPLALAVPTTLTFNNVVQLDNLENLLKILVSIAVCFHFLHGIWVDDLVTESSEREVRSLRNVKDVLGVGAMDGAT